VTLISTGLTQVFPYRIRQSDSLGNPTATVLNIDSIDVLKQNVSPNNPVLPTGTLGTTATLPDGDAGNQFLLVKFSHKLQIDSVLSNLQANQTNSGLTTAISILEYNPVNETTNIVRGRGFVGGFTYAQVGGELQLVKAAEARDGGVVVLDPTWDGFPAGFSGDTDLVDPKSFVFVPDVDGDLSSFETFTPNRLIRILVTNAVRDSDDKTLSDEVCTSTTVDTDPNPPDVLGAVSGGMVAISPGNNAANVDPNSRILVQFNKPVQPADVGAFFDAGNLVPPSGGVTLQVSAGANQFNVLYYADPLGFGDFCNYALTPAYVLPGSPPPPATPTRVSVTVNRNNIRGLTASNLGLTVSTDYTTGEGAGLVNAPVAPEAIYVGMGGPNPGLSVIDLNGFGQGTGDINDSRFPLNPNIGAQGVDPVLAPGTSNLDAGSRGVFTLTKDSVGNTRLLADPQVGQIGDLHIGAPLDVIFNNENINRNSNSTNHINPSTFLSQPGNCIAIAPHPNPPKLRFPPPNPARAIFGDEPTKTSTSGPVGSVFATAPPCQPSPVNQLGVGNPQVPASNTAGIGILGAFMPGVFYGPQPPPGSPPPPLAFCPYTSRQQVGHFLYVLDRDNRQVLVVNSNRMTVLDTIRLSDPFDMAMAPNLRVLAVSNFSSASVVFIDINPLSPTFHTVIGETRVDPGPTSVAWQPDGEVLMVVSPSSNSASILSGLDFSRLRTVSGFLNEPIDVVLTPRYQTTGHLSGVYFGYILNANGTIAVFESGPDGVNGIGFNDIIGTVPGITFRRARKLVLDPTSSIGAVFVAHVDDFGLGQVSRLELTSSPTGPLPTNQFQGGIIIPPTFRQKTWTVVQRYGGQDFTTPTRSQFSGNAIVDIAMDELVNQGAQADQVTPFNANIPASPFAHSSKGWVKTPTIVGGGQIVTPPYLPKYLFAAVADRGRVDVMEINSGRLVASIEVEGIPQVLAQYWRH
jgi:hypothetical protein